MSTLRRQALQWLRCTDPDAKARGVRGIALGGALGAAEPIEPAAGILIQMPDDFYRQWLQVAREEALHFELLRDHLATLDKRYGDFDAHDGLWQMAERTRHDVLARMALVPRTLEARGLDASPAVKAKLLAAGDGRGGEILDLILRDEIGHVAVGNRWYRWLCLQRGLDPVPTYAALAHQHGAPRPRGPFNLAARRAAGFDDDELAALATIAP